MYVVKLSDEEKLGIIVLGLFLVLVSFIFAICLASPLCMLNRYLTRRREKRRSRISMPSDVVVHQHQHHNRRQPVGRSLGRGKRRDRSAVDSAVAPPPPSYEYSTQKRYPGQAGAKFQSGADPSSQTWRNINLVSQLESGGNKSTNQQTGDTGHKFDADHNIDYGDYFHPPKAQQAALDYYQTLCRFGFDSQDMSECDKNFKSCAELMTTSAFLRSQSSVASASAERDNLPLMIKFSITSELCDVDGGGRARQVIDPMSLSSSSSGPEVLLDQVPDVSMDMSSISSGIGGGLGGDGALQTPQEQSATTNTDIVKQIQKPSLSSIYNIVQAMPSAQKTIDDTSGTSSISGPFNSNTNTNDSDKSTGFSGSESTAGLSLHDTGSNNELVPSRPPTRPLLLKLMTGLDGGDKSDDQRCRFVIKLNVAENVKTFTDPTILSDIYVQCDILGPSKTRYLRNRKSAAKDGIVIVTFRTQAMPKIPGLTHDILFNSTFITPLLSTSLLRDGYVRLRIFEQIKHVSDVCIGELKLPITQVIRPQHSENACSSFEDSIASYECQLLRQSKGKICLGISYLPTSNRIIFNAYRAIVPDSKEIKNLKLKAGSSYFLRFMMIINGCVAKKQRTPVNIKPSWDSQESITFDLVNVSVDQPTFIVALVLRNPSLNKSLGNLTSSSSGPAIDELDRYNNLSDANGGETFGVNLGPLRSWYHYKINNGQADATATNNSNKLNVVDNQSSYYYASEPESPTTPDQVESGGGRRAQRKISGRHLKRDTVIGHFVIGHELWGELRNKPRQPITREFVIY